jgi:hypothetical protein
MKNKYRTEKFVVLLLMMTLVSGCTKEIYYNLMNGNLKGVVYCSDGITYLPVTVLLEGDELSKTTISDSSGNFLFTGVNTGTYNLKFSKEGFGDYYIHGFSFIGGDSITETAPIVLLSQLPNASVSNLRIEEMTVESKFNRICKTIYWKADFTPDKSLTTQYVAYLGTDKDVSYKNYKVHSFPTAANNSLELSDYDTITFKKNSKIYMIVYPCCELGMDYPDLTTGCNVHSGIQPTGASNVASIVVK